MTKLLTVAANNAGPFTKNNFYSYVLRFSPTRYNLTHNPQYLTQGNYWLLFFNFLNFTVHDNDILMKLKDNIILLWVFNRMKTKYRVSTATLHFQNEIWFLNLIDVVDSQSQAMKKKRMKTKYHVLAKSNIKHIISSLKSSLERQKHHCHSHKLRFILNLWRLSVSFSISNPRRSGQLTRKSIE
jgi:hypothetical protein